MTVGRPPIRYYGAKWRLAPWIIGHFPPHECYVELFAGAAGILLRKEPSLLEVYNDLDVAVVTFFRVLRTRMDELLAAIELTPYARLELVEAYESMDGLDEVEQARRFFVRSMQTRNGGRATYKQSWRYQKHHVRHGFTEDDWGNLTRLEETAQRLRMVQIECDDYSKVIPRFDASSTLFYADPPYLRSVRTARWGYNGYTHEMGEEGQHRDLAAKLHQVAGMVIISHYPCELYDELYGDWYVSTSSAQTDKADHAAIEHIWLNATAAAALPQHRMEFSA